MYCDYSIRPRFSSKVRAGVYLSATFVGIIVGIRYFGQLIDRSLLLFYQRKCLSYVSDQLTLPVFSPNIVKEVRSQEEAAHAIEAGCVLPRVHPEHVLCEGWNEILLNHPEIHVYTKGESVFEPVRVGTVPDCWTRYASQAGFLGTGQINRSRQGLAPEGVIFLGRLRSLTGETRLVVANASNGIFGTSRDSIWDDFSIQNDIITPAGVFTAPQQTRSWYFTRGAFEYAECIFYPGSVVPDDPSKFKAKLKINYRDPVNGNAFLGTIEGWLVGTLVDVKTLNLSLEGFGDPPPNQLPPKIGRKQ